MASEMRAVDLGAWVCNKCGQFGEAESRNGAERQHKLLSPAEDVETERAAGERR
jgi:hypothetical protein